MKLNKELRVNFASTQDIARFSGHAAGMICAHPLQVVRIVSASFKFAGVPRPKAFALSTEHLVAAFGFVNKNFAIRARFSVGFEKCDRSDSVRIADMVRVVSCGLEFSAIVAGVLVADATLPSGRDEAIAIGISAAMNECFSGRVRVMLRLCGQLSASVKEVIFEGGERLDLSMNILDLRIKTGQKFVMYESGLSGRKHGLFLSEEDVLLMLSEVASEEGLGKADVLKLRMSELSVAEEALGNGDIIAREESLVARAAGGFGTRVERACDGFVIGGIEAFETDGAGHNCRIK